MEGLDPKETVSLCEVKHEKLASKKLLVICHRKKIAKLTYRAPVLRQRLFPIVSFTLIVVTEKELLIVLLEICLQVYIVSLAFFLAY